MGHVAKREAERTRHASPPVLDLIRIVVEERHLPATSANVLLLIDAIRAALAAIEGGLPLAEETD